MKTSATALLRKKRSAPSVGKANPGSSPGVLHHSSVHEPTRISVTAYGEEGYTEFQDIEELDQIEELAAEWPVVWIGVNGLANIQMIEQLRDMFSLEQMLLEDVLDISQRPKIEVYEHLLFAITKSVNPSDAFDAEQISMFVKKNVVIVFQEHSSNRFEQVRGRVRHGMGKIRHHGPDYLFYALLDEVIDRYFPVLDHLNSQLLAIEEQIFTGDRSRDSSDVIKQIHHAKSDLMQLHQAIRPVADMIKLLMRDDTPLITKPTAELLKDCFDHSVQASEMAQFYRDTATGLLNTYLAYEGHKTNEIVKVLTMVSAVFIPLTLVASIFGMNFENPYPSWNYEHGFALAIGVMGVMVFGMMLLFKRMGWLAKGWPFSQK